MSTNPHSKNFFNSIGNPDDLSGDGTELLKLAIGAKFIRYFIATADGSTILFYGDYSLLGVNNKEDLAEQLSTILAKDPFLSRSFGGVKICWSTDFEIIPATFFDRNELSAETTANEILNGEAQFIFELPYTLTEILKGRFSQMEHYHSGSAMIEQLRQTGMANASHLFINIHADTIEIAAFADNGGLRIYNSYEYKAYQDHIYFVLLVADELKLNREEVKAILMGEVNQDSKLYDVTHRYFSHIDFIGSPSGISFSKAFAEYPRHFNYLLYNL